MISKPRTGTSSPVWIVIVSNSLQLLCHHNGLMEEFFIFILFFSILDLQSLHFYEIECVNIYFHGGNMPALVVDLLIQRAGSMTLRHGRGKWYLTQIRFIIILVLSWFMALSTAQQVENRKNTRWEHNLLYQECTYEVQEQGTFFFFFILFLNIHLHMSLAILRQKYLHEKWSETFSGKINELLVKTHLEIFFLKRIHPHND